MGDWTTAALLVAVLCLRLSQGLADDERLTVRPQDTGEALANPGMGWVFHYYDNVPQNYGSRLKPSDTLDDFPGLTVIYLRIPWSYLEPEEGRFNWAVLDGPTQRWVDRGKQVAFRFSCSESWTRYATPRWVEEAGAKGYNFRPGEGVCDDGPFWEPDFDDPVFLEKLDHFLAAAATRYDGSPQVAFVDVGSFGVWGEGHTYSSTRLDYPASTIRRHLDLHLKHFRHTLLAANDDFALHGRGPEVLDYAREKGLTLRDDSILVQGGDRAYLSAELAPAFWPHVPVILESEHYGGSRDRGNWQDGGKYLEAVEEYHASYASIHWWPREFLEENRDLIRRMNLRLGYRLQLVEASWPERVLMGERWRLAWQWRNAGVAPCLPGGFPAVTLRDSEGGIVGVFVDEGLDLRELPVGPPGQAETRAHEAAFELPFDLRPGTYDVLVSVGTRTGTPTIALPLSEGDAQGRYRLGRMRVMGHYGAVAGDPRRAGDQWLLPVTWTVNLPLPAGVTPFCHFDRDGKIAFQGFPDPAGPRQALESPGTVELGLVFSVPEWARGQSFDVRTGLWVPERLGRPDERMIPDNGDLDRRMPVGTLSVAQDGTVTLAEVAGD